MKRVLAALALTLAASTSAAWAAPAGALADEPGASSWFETDQGAVRLVSAAAGTGDRETVALGLEFRLAPGWKIYWRSPGDAGYPPSVDWRGSQNLAGARIDWPAPRRFSLFGIDTMGYEDEVVLPIEARLERAGAPLALRASVDWLTCKEICVPYQATLDLAVPAGPATPTPAADSIARFAAKVPGDGAAVGLVPEAATLLPGKRPALELRVRAVPPLQEPDAFVEGPPGVGFGRPSVRRDGDVAVLRLPVEGDAAAVAALANRPATITVVDGGEGGRAAERSLTVALGAGSADLADLLPMLALAVLGGFILNLMPCVLPVLSIKLLGFMEQAGRSRAAVRAASLATASGVIASFLALAGLLAGLKAAGVAVGWGLQFQQPVFLAAMIAVLTLFACNLWGFFEVRLPGWAGSAGALGSDGNLAGNFATGALATLLATPCSAPFLGTAVGFALAGGPFEILAVFAALGVGLALPYLLVALVPTAARLLPRPGRWMLTLRRGLGFLLIGTAAWLLSVLAAQAGAAAALTVAALAAIAVLLLALARRPTLRRPLLHRALVAAALLAAVPAPLLLAGSPAPTKAAEGWRPFERDAIDGLVADGKTVFVDVTADWCLTCQVNKRLVIDTAPVRGRLRAPGVVPMLADWTRPNDAIADYLRSFGRYGIPFNAVYGPGAPNGIALSELLTADEVVAALTRAAGPGKPGERAVARAPAASAVRAGRGG